MRADSVVLFPVIFDDNAGLGQGPELLAVEALVAEAAVEGFYEAVLPWAARLDVEGLYLVCCQPALEFLDSDKLRAVVGADVVGRSVLSRIGSNPATQDRIKTSHSEAGVFIEVA